MDKNYTSDLILCVGLFILACSTCFAILSSVWWRPDICWKRIWHFFNLYSKLHLWVGNSIWRFAIWVPSVSALAVITLALNLMYLWKPIWKLTSVESLWMLLAILSVLDLSDWPVVFRKRSGLSGWRRPAAPATVITCVICFHMLIQCELIKTADLWS